MEQRPNDFDGFSYYITDPGELEHLDARASILLEPGQIEFFTHYPKSLEGLVRKAAPLAQVPNLAKWLASLWNKPLVLEVHTTSELYNLNAVWLRFMVREEDQEKGLTAWQPAINRLGFRNTRNIQVPDLLNQIYQITGEINHNGYGIAGRLHHPDLIGNEASFYETLYNDKAFYRIPELQVFWEFPGGAYESEEERREFGLYFFDEGLAYVLDLYFENLLNENELRINREGQVID